MDAIDSIRHQSYHNWEIVIVDDHSTDNSVDIYKKLEGDDRIHIFFNSDNMGCGYTKHQCVIHASGDICGFLDPDDALTEDAIQIMVDEYEKHPDASLINSTCFNTDEHLNVISISSYGCSIPQGHSFLTYRQGITAFATFRKKCYEQTEGIDPLMLRAVDHDLYYKLEEVGSIVHVEEYLYKQRCSPHSLSLNANAYKAGVWHSYACVQAMKRRGLKDESLMLFPVEAALHREYVRGCEKILSSRIYRLGKALVSPVI